MTARWDTSGGTPDDCWHLLQQRQRARLWAKASSGDRGEVDTDNALTYLAEVDAEGRPTALGALKANADLVTMLAGAQWSLMAEAADEGATWAEMGQALGITAQSAHTRFLTAVEQQIEVGENLDLPSMSEAARASAEAVKRPVAERRAGADVSARRVAADALRLNGIAAYWPSPAESMPTRQEALDLLTDWLEANPDSWTRHYEPHRRVLEFSAGRSPFADNNPTDQTSDVDSQANG